MSQLGRRLQTSFVMTTSRTRPGSLPFVASVSTTESCTRVLRFRMLSSTSDCRNGLAGAQEDLAIDDVALGRDVEDVEDGRDAGDQIALLEDLERDDVDDLDDLALGLLVLDGVEVGEGVVDRVVLVGGVLVEAERGGGAVCASGARVTPTRARATRRSEPRRTRADDITPYRRGHGARTASSAIVEDARCAALRSSSRSCAVLFAVSAACGARTGLPDAPVHREAGRAG